MLDRNLSLFVVFLACGSLLCSCKTLNDSKVTESHFLGRLNVSHEGYERRQDDVWHAVVALKNSTEVPIECIFGSIPKATAELPEGTMSIAAVELSEEELPVELHWNSGVPQMPISMMKRYGLVQTRLVGAAQSERIFLPLYLTPSHLGKTHNQLMIGIRQTSDREDPETYDTYIAELAL